MSEGYLVLSRKPHEEIVVTIPASNKDTVMRVAYAGQNGNQARLGFNAERCVSIVRSELIERDKEKGAA